jgi:uncharacterized membrane protein YkgB
MKNMNFLQRIINNHIIAVTVGIVYLWFGVLKFFPGISPAEELAMDTVSQLVFFQMPSEVSIVLLAIWETLLGIVLILNIQRSMAIKVAYVHLVLTFSPFLLFPELTFANPPFGFTLVGQYIAKNIILVAALITLDKQTPRVAV